MKLLLPTLTLCLLFTYSANAHNKFSTNKIAPYGAVFLRGQSSVPTTMRPGEKKQVRLRVKNTGTNTWIFNGSQPYRLGSGNSNPNLGGEANDFTWSEFQHGGQMPNLLNGRAFMNRNVPPQGTFDFVFSITAPQQSGSHQLSVRMVHELVTWFGENAVWNITVNDGGLPIRVDKWRLQFWNNRNLSGNPVRELYTTPKRDGGFLFNWGTRRPANGVNPDNFSVRFTRKYYTARPLFFRFYTTTSDGVRLYYRGRKVIDKWRVHPTPTTHRSTLIIMPRGLHEIRMEYFEATGNAYASLGFGGTNNAAVASPKVNMYPLPAHNAVNVASQNFELSKGTTLMIRDQNGKVVHSETLQKDADIKLLDTSHLKAGMYIISLANNGQVVTQKFYIEK